jgi:hypothetical protein
METRAVEIADKSINATTIDPLKTAKQSPA